MKKVVFGVVLVLLIAVGGGVYFLLSNLDDIVKTAIETYGSEATKTSVKVNNVKIVLQDGSGAIRGLTVGNPQGFASPQAFSLGEIATQIDLNSLSGDLVVIEHITVRGPEIFFELNHAGKNNLEALKQNLASGSSGSSAASGSSSSSSSSSSGAEPKLIVRKLLFVDGNIHAKVAPLNKDYELKLPKVEMSNLGGSNGATPEQIADQVLKVLTDRAIAEVKKQGIDQYKKQLEAEVNKRINAEKQKITEEVNKKVGKEVGDKAGDKLKGILSY